MPIIGGRYYMNPAMGEALEEARARAEGGNAPRGSEEEIAGHESSPARGRRGNEPERDPRGRFQADHEGEDAPVHRMEIECAEGGFVAHVHRRAAQAAGEAGSLRDGGEDPGRLEAARPMRRTTHVFTNPHDLAEFVRGELSPRARGWEPSG